MIRSISAGLEERRRAAAEVDRVGRITVLPSGSSSPAHPLNFREQRAHVALLERRVEQTSIEVAVVADGGTERDVDVEAEHEIYNRRFW